MGMPISQQDRNVSAALEKIAPSLHHIALAHLMHKAPYYVRV